MKTRMPMPVEPHHPGRPSAAKAPSARKRMTVMLVSMSVLIALVVAFQQFKTVMIGKAMAAMAATVQVVSSTKAVVHPWQAQLEAVGTLRAVNGTDLAAEVAGIVDEIQFESGDWVPAGKLLLRLRSNEDEAKLAQLQATAELANINYQRDLKQLQARAVSQATVDSDAATLKSARAQVAQQQALIAQKQIRAPFAGRVGLRQVDVGQYLAAGTAIATLQSLDPIYLDFHLPQQALDQLKVGHAVTVKVDTYPGQTFAGEISAINSKVDPSNRNVQVRATLKNPDAKLVPGMYATVDIDVGQPQPHVTLPQTAVTYNPYGNIVYLIEEQGKDDKGEPKLVVRQAFVTTGDTRGDQVAVTQGVKEGDLVVSAGQMKLRNGAVVRIDNSVQPKNEAAPAPKDH